MTTSRDRARRPGAGTLDAGGGAAQWCRDVVRVTRPVHRVDAGVTAVCAAAPHRPRVASGPLLGETLPQVVERTARVEQVPDDAADARDRRRREAAARDLTGGNPDDCPPGIRPRPRRVEAAEPAPPPGRTPRPAACPPDRLSAVPPRPTPSPPGLGPRVTTARLRALVGPDTGSRNQGFGRAPDGGDRGRRPPWPVTRTGPAADGAVARVRPGEDLGADLGADVAARLARRIGAAGPGGLEVLGRMAARATGPVADLTGADLRALAAGPVDSGRPPVSPPAGGAGEPVDAPVRRRRRRDPEGERTVGHHRTPSGSGERAAIGRTRTTPGEAAGLGPTPPPTRPDPSADVQGLRALTRFAEPPAQPPRLGGGPLSDDTEAARGLPWTGTAPVTPDVRAATTAVGLNEPDLELVMTRVLEDAARRHGIEV